MLVCEYLQRDALGRWLPFGEISRRNARPVVRSRNEIKLAERRQRVAELWPTMSIRDMASELDEPVAGIQRDARLLGLPPRPISVQP